MKKFVNGMLLVTMAIALVLAGCDDEEELLPPTTVTLSAGGISTDFKTFLFTSVGSDDAYILIVMGANASDTLVIYSLSLGQMETDSPMTLENSILGVFGTLGGGQITAVSYLGATGTLTFTRLDTLGFVSGQFSDNATLRGITADESEVTVSISGGFAAFGGSVDIFDTFFKKQPLSPGEGERSAVPFD